MRMLLCSLTDQLSCSLADVTACERTTSALLGIAELSTDFRPAVILLIPGDVRMVRVRRIRA